ncbi:MAG: histidinol dehydrogenase [Candidatus Eremiobacteraeota bacterium]|nr:histidinol dehydrogenase [Candidatus Eremiobacteraeota bacterium]
MNVIAASDSVGMRALLDGSWVAPEAIAAEVGRIIAEVRARGDAAVVEYARRFDDESFSITKLRVPIPMLETARSLLEPEIAAALELAKERIARFHRRQRQPDVSYAEEDGTRYALERRPLCSVGVYAPQGAAVAVLACAMPAKIAGVKRVVVLSPPTKESLPAAVLFACALSGVDELYAVGGAHAIAAAAFGTASIAPVHKIVGRGGLWTTEAKRQVFGRCGVDALAGPPEVLIVADDGASSEYIVGELLAAAERPGTTRLAVLSESRPLLEAVAQLIDTLDPRALERNEFLDAAISTHCRLIEASTREELLDVLNRFAPAYLSLQVRDPSAYLERVYAAGAVFVGDMTPMVSGEYLAGTSPVAPTSGTARFTSALSLADFTRTFSVIENSAERVASDATALSALADFDGFPHHAQSARMRCGS